MYFLYILLCDQKIFYVGITDNLERRLSEHQSGYSTYTKKFSDVKLMYTEEFLSRGHAEQREQQLKKWSVAKKKALIAGNIDELQKLSKGS